MTLLHSPTPHCLYVRKFEYLLLFTICGKRPVPFYYLLSHSPTLPLSVSNCLSMPYSLIVSLYLALLQPLCLKMRLSWLL